MVPLKWWQVLLSGSGVLILCYFLFAVVVVTRGSSLPSQFTCAHTARFDLTRAEIWARLKYPEKSTQVRESSNAIRREAAPSDTFGTLVLLYERDSLAVSYLKLRHVSIAKFTNFIRYGEGTIVRVETWALLETPTHRQMFPAMLKRQSEDAIRDLARELGVPGPDVRETAPIQWTGARRNGRATESLALAQLRREFLFRAQETAP